MLRINRTQFLIGAVALFIGGLVYVLDRPSDQTYFINNLINVSFHEATPKIFGALGNSLPAFVHVFSFILITAGVLSCQKRGWVVICVSWLCLDLAFEFGQKFKAVPLKVIPGWFSGIPFLENTKAYFFRGTFDVLDLVAIALGTLAAYFVLLTTNKDRRRVMT